MKKIMVSSVFFLIASILFSTKYISVSIFLVKSDSLSTDLIKETLKILPFELTMICWIAFLMGIVFLVSGIKEYRRG